MIRAYVFDGIRSAVPKHELDHAFATKDEIAYAVEASLVGMMTEYGWRIMHVLITDIDPDPSVKIAMNEINGKFTLFHTCFVDIVYSIATSS